MCISLQNPTPQVLTPSFSTHINSAPPVVPAVNMREEARGWFVAGMKPYHIQNRASPAARTNQFKLIQQRASPLTRLVQVEAGIIRLRFVYQYQGTGAAPYCVTIESVVAHQEEYSYLYASCTCTFCTTRPTPCADQWCKHSCALALLLVDKSDKVRWSSSC